MLVDVLSLAVDMRALKTSSEAKPMMMGRRRELVQVVYQPTMSATTVAVTNAIMNRRLLW
jgi:hypothetical protein